MKLKSLIHRSKAIFFEACVLCATQQLQASPDSLHTALDAAQTSLLKKTPFKEIIAPSVLLSYGIISLESHYLLNTNQGIRDQLQQNIDRKISIDDFSQYAGTISIFALDAIGIKAKHNLKQRLFTAALSNAIMATSINIIKNTSPVWRPDNSKNNSFPSGHTATAFVGAELIWQEYKDKSIWYGIAGYGVAAGTGFFRMYNDKHWLSDVAMGAGIGILSTKIAYWVLALTDHKLAQPKSNYAVVPGYNGKQFTFAANMHF